MTRRTHHHRQADEGRRRLVAAVLAAIVLVGVTVVAFTKDNPFSEPYRFKAHFEATAALRKDAPVRVAGVDVGRVTGIQSGPNGSSIVEMELSDDDAGPLREDARVEIQPRLVLEGNNAVKLHPGSPGARELPDGATIPKERTITAVQLDEVIDVFDAPARSRLQSSAKELSRGLGRGEDGAPSGADSLRAAVEEFDRTLQPVGRAAAASRGRTPGDLRKALGGTAGVAAQLARDPDALAGLVAGYARVSRTLAANDAELARTVTAFARTAETAPRTMPRLSSALDAVTDLAPRLRTALRRAPGALRATDGILDEIGKVVAPAELPRLVRRLGPVTATLPEFLRRARDLSPGITDVAQCLDRNVIPTLNMVVPDGNLTTGDPVWLELMHLGASAGGSSGGFDGNGSFLRMGVTEGDVAVTGNLPNLGQFDGFIPSNTSMNPEWLGYNRFPAERPDQRCADQKLPDLSARGGRRPYDWLTPKTTPAMRAKQRTRLAKDLRSALKTVTRLTKRSAGR